MHTWETGFLARPPKNTIEPYREIMVLFALHKLVLKLSNRARLVCLIDLILYVPVNNFSVMSGRVFLG